MRHTSDQALVFLQKHQLFPLKSGFAFRSDSCNALPGTRYSGFRVWFAICIAYLTFRHLVELLTGKVKHFSYSFRKLMHRAENIRRRTGEKLYQESSSFIPILRTKKISSFFTTQGNEYLLP